MSAAAAPGSIPPHAHPGTGTGPGTGDTDHDLISMRRRAHDAKIHVGPASEQSGLLCLLAYRASFALDAPVLVLLLPLLASLVWAGLGWPGMGGRWSGAGRAP
ncbi:hypothetical protein E4U53_004206 [Claviceps sorghi]|nr:hypothetical protein E4U53_004206 [Claviceps sorghi]